MSISIRSNGTLGLKKVRYDVENEEMNAIVVE